MAKVSVVARVLGEDRIECRVEAPNEHRLTLTGAVGDQVPAVVGSGDAVFLANPALLSNAWAFAKFRFDAVSLSDEVLQENAAKRAKAHQAVAEWIADVASEMTTETKRAWCSGCFEKALHQKAVMPAGQVPAYVCTGCGVVTLSCVAPGCQNMALRTPGGIKLPRYCAEHRHETPGFAKAKEKMQDLSDYVEFLRFEKTNLGAATKVLGLGVAGIALATPAALFAAPAIGGAVGTLVGGYAGIAATNFGLAFLGGGAVAAGGFGMAGGTLVVTALGGALGGALGASVMNSYVREDKSFHIEMLRGGTGVPVIVCNGFLTQGSKGWGEWKSIISDRYPDSPVYRVHWGAKELKNLGALVGTGAGGFAAAVAVQNAAAGAVKAAAKKLGPLGPVLLAADLAKNPWHVAKTRADKTGVIVADLLARTEAQSFVLVGHSLGARAMVVAAQTLGTKAGAPRIEAVHLLGAAIGAKSDWHTLTNAVGEAVYNYHSRKDGVLRFLYTAAEAGSTAAGLKGFVPADHKLRNVDVSIPVTEHSAYVHNVSLEKPVQSS